MIKFFIVLLGFTTYITYAEQLIDSNEFFYGELLEGDAETCRKSKLMLTVNFVDLKLTNKSSAIQFMFINESETLLGLDQDFFSSLNYTFDIFKVEKDRSVVALESDEFVAFNEPASVLKLLSPKEMLIVEYGLPSKFKGKWFESMIGRHQLNWKIRVKIRNIDNPSSCYYSGNVPLEY